MVVMTALWGPIVLVLWFGALALVVHVTTKWWRERRPVAERPDPLVDLVGDLAVRVSRLEAQRTEGPYR